MTLCYRLSSGKYPVNSGVGAALHGGRWNPAGSEVIYAAASSSLAVLEILVHYSVLPRDFVLTEIKIPSEVAVEHVDSGNLPRGWDKPTPSRATQDIGRKWIVSGRSAVMEVPSAVVPAESIYVLNPKHRDFQLLKFAPPLPFRFDARLKR